MATNGDRLMAAQRALALHYLTASDDDVAIAMYDAEPYLATRGAAYRAVLDYLVGDEPWWEQISPTHAQVAWEVVTEVLPDSGPENLHDMVENARQRLTYVAGVKAAKQRAQDEALEALRAKLAEPGHPGDPRY